MTLPSPPVVCADAWVLYGTLGPHTQADPAAGWPLLRLCDALAGMLQPVDDLVRDVAGLPGWSQILDLDRCPTSCLPWLGQWVGVNVDPSLLDTEQRAQIQDQQAEARGTPAAILAVAQSYVGPDTTVRLVERDGDAYHLTVSVFNQGLIGATYNDLQTHHPTISGFEAAYPTYADLPASEAELTTAVQDAVPAGLVVAVNTSAHGTYGDVASFFPTISGFEAALPTWADVTAWVPPS